MFFNISPFYMGIYSGRASKVSSGISILDSMRIDSNTSILAYNRWISIQFPWHVSSISDNSKSVS